MAPHLLSRSQADFFLRGLTSDPPQRSDGRHLLAFRSLQIDTGIAAQANGSSQITLGGTEIFCGIKAEVRSFGDDSDDEDEEEEEGEPIGDLGILADLGLSDFDMGAIIDNLDLSSVEMLVEVADKIKLNPQFRKAVEAAVG